MRYSLQMLFGLKDRDFALTDGRWSYTMSVLKTHGNNHVRGLWLIILLTSCVPVLTTDESSIREVESEADLVWSAGEDSLDTVENVSNVQVRLGTSDDVYFLGIFDDGERCK